MQQVAIFLSGERDYKKIVGGTGPLVYPGAHVWIYRWLYALTDQGRDVQRAQYIFALVYLGALAVVVQCYRRAKVCFHFLFSPSFRLSWSTGVGAWMRVLGERERSREAQMVKKTKKMG